MRRRPSRAAWGALLALTVVLALLSWRDMKPPHPDRRQAETGPRVGLDSHFLDADTPARALPDDGLPVTVAAERAPETFAQRQVNLLFGAVTGTDAVRRTITVWEEKGNTVGDLLFSCTASTSCAEVPRPLQGAEAQHRVLPLLPADAAAPPTRPFMVQRPSRTRPSPDDPLADDKNFEGYVFALDPARLPAARRDEIEIFPKWGKGD